MEGGDVLVLSHQRSQERHQTQLPAQEEHAYTDALSVVRSPLTLFLLLLLLPPVFLYQQQLAGLTQRRLLQFAQLLYASRTFVHLAA